MGRKRKSSGLIPFNKGYVPPCRICEAPGTGFHYGVNTCEACKGFFHRSIEQHTHYRCKKNSKCTIHFKLYSFCRKCRYEKCLAFGMSKTAIKTGRYSSLKKTENILEVKRLERAHACSQSFQTALDNSRILHAYDNVSSAVKQPCSPPRHVDTPPDSTTSFDGPYVLSGPKEFESPLRDLSPSMDVSESPPSESVPSPVNCLVTSCKNFSVNHVSPTACASSLPTSSGSCPTLDVDLAGELPSFQLSPVASPSESTNTVSTSLPLPAVDSPGRQSSPPLSVSPLHIADTTATSSPFYPQSSDRNHHVDMFTCPSTTSSHLTSGDDSSSSSSSSCFPWSQTPLPENHTQPQCVAKVVSSTILDMSSRQLTELPIQKDRTPASSGDARTETEAIGLEKTLVCEEPGAKIMEMIAGLYADSDHVVRTLVEIERQTLRYEARDLSPAEILSQQIKHKEDCSIRMAMFGRKTLLQHSEYEEVRRETGLDVDGREQYLSGVLKSLENAIKKLATFAKGIPGFRYMPLQLMVTLIKEAHWKACCISALKLTNADLMVTMSRSEGWVCPLDFDERSASTYVIDAMKSGGKLQKANLTDDEIAVILAMAFVTPDRANPIDSPIVRSIHSHLEDILMKLLQKSHEQPLRVFADVVSLFRDLRSFESKAATNYLNNVQNTFKSELCKRPILQEILTGINQNK